MLQIGGGAQSTFKYKYQFPYFVARALSEDEGRLNAHVPGLIEGLHREQSASILMLLVYLVRDMRDKRVVEGMLAKARA